MKLRLKDGHVEVEFAGSFRRPTEKDIRGFTFEESQFYGRAVEANLQGEEDRVKLLS